MKTWLISKSRLTSLLSSEYIPFKFLPIYFKILYTNSNKECWLCYLSQALLWPLLFPCLCGLKLLNAYVIWPSEPHFPFCIVGLTITASKGDYETKVRECLAKERHKYRSHPLFFWNGFVFWNLRDVVIP